jgi:hypothetical protein
MNFEKCFEQCALSMRPDFDKSPTVEKNSAIPIARLRVLQRFDEVRLSEMRRGIIFILAAWSGPAVMGLRRFTKLIKSLDIHSLDLVVLDTDCLTEDSASQLFDAPFFTAAGWDENEENLPRLADSPPEQPRTQSMIVVRQFASKTQLECRKRSSFVISRSCCWWRPRQVLPRNDADSPQS